MLLKGPWRSAPSGSPSRINGASLLSKGLVFAFSGHHGLDLISGTRPIATSTTESSIIGGQRSQHFTGGVSGSSNLDFGTPLVTADLGEEPATWAFLATTNSLAEIALACHSDNNSVGGWQIGYRTSAGGIGAEFVRSGQNLRAFIAEAPTPNTPFTFVITYDGGSAAAGIKFYLDGQLRTNTNTQDAAGGSAPVNAEHLYLGQHRFSDAISHNGDIAVALIANRVWSDAEARAFHKNPYGVFGTPSSITNILGRIASSGAITGTSSISFGQSGTLSTSVALTGSSAIVFSQSGTLTGTGAALSGTSSITFGQSGTLSSQAHMTGIAAIAASATGILQSIVQITGATAITFGASASFGDPEISSAVAPANREVDVIFLQAVDEVAALNPANYSITHGITVSSVQKITSSWYRLKTSRMVQGTIYSISSSNIGPA